MASASCEDTLAKLVLSRFSVSFCHKRKCCIHTFKHKYVSMCGVSVYVPSNVGYPFPLSLKHSVLQGSSLNQKVNNLQIALLGPFFQRVDKSSFKEYSQTNQAGKRTLRPDQLPTRADTSQAAQKWFRTTELPGKGTILLVELTAEYIACSRLPSS